MYHLVIRALQLLIAYRWIVLLVLGILAVTGLILWRQNGASWRAKLDQQAHDAPSFLRRLGARLLYHLLAWRVLRWVLAALVVVFLVFVAQLWQWMHSSPTSEVLRQFLTDPSTRAELITKMDKPCRNAPFLLPSAGFVGLLYQASSAPYTSLNPHPGIDIFGDGEPGIIPVVAAYDGYLTRLAGWKSAVIIRHPHDPLDPARQIWTYYTHMASRDGQLSYIDASFPAGTTEKFVAQGTLLGYQGEFAGNGWIALHLHFSVVQSDSTGAFLNESELVNTLDPSPYLGMNVNDQNIPIVPVHCQ